MSGSRKKSPMVTTRRKNPLGRRNEKAVHTSWIMLSGPPGFLVGHLGAFKGHQSWNALELKQAHQLLNPRVLKRERCPGHLLVILVKLLLLAVPTDEHNFHVLPRGLHLFVRGYQLGSERPTRRAPVGTEIQRPPVLELGEGLEVDGGSILALQRFPKLEDPRETERLPREAIRLRSDSLPTVLGDQLGLRVQHEQGRNPLDPKL